MSDKNREARTRLYCQALADFLQSGGEEEAFLSLKMHAQLCEIDLREHQRLATAVVAAHGSRAAGLEQAMARWLEERVQQHRERCGRCGLTLYDTHDRCLQCGAAIPKGKTSVRLGGSRKAMVKWGHLRSEVRYVAVVLLAGGMLALACAGYLILRAWR